MFGLCAVAASRKIKDMEASDIILMVSGCIVLLFGAYIIYLGIRMNRTKEPPKMLMTYGADVKKGKNPEGFCDYLRNKSILFGFISILYGVFCFVGIVRDSFFVNLAAIAAFLMAVLWYFKEVNRANDDYIR